LADWRRESGSLEAEGTPQALAEEFATAIEQQYSDDDIKALVKNKGLKAE
jgi:hypothetical protein